MIQILALLASLFFAAPVQAQCNGVFSANQVCGKLGSPGLPGPINVSSVLLPYIDVAQATPPVLCNGSDQTANLTAVLSSFFTTGARLQFHACIYLFSNPIILPNTDPGNGGTVQFPTQPTYLFEGAGPIAYGITPTSALSAFAGTIFDMRSSNTSGHIQTYGTGLVALQNLTLTDLANSNGVPFFYSTYTTFYGTNVSVIGSSDRCNNSTPSQPNQDAFVFGGTSSSQATHNINNPYQGYGTSLTNIFTDHIRRVIYGRTFTNHLKAEGIVAWPCNGSNLKGAISLTSIATSGSSYSQGDILTVTGGIVDTVPGGVPARVIVDTIGGGGGITAAHVYELGDYTTAPSNPVSVTGGTGTLATFNLNWQADGVAVENQSVTGTNAFSWDIHTSEIDFCGYSYLARTNGTFGFWRLSGDDFGICAGNTNVAVMNFDAGAGFNSLISNLAGTQRLVQDQGATPTNGCSNNNILSPTASTTSDFSCIFNLFATSATIGKATIQATGSSPLTIQPTTTQTSGSTLAQLLTAAGVTTWALNQDGGISTTNGTITNTNALGASLLSNGRQWDTGGNGTTLIERGNGVQVKSDNGNLQVTFAAANTPRVDFANGAGGATDTIISRLNAGEIQLQNATSASSTGRLDLSLWGSGTIYTSAGVQVPACNAGNNGLTAIVGDATNPTYRATYTASGTAMARVLCVNGTGWITD